MIPADLSAYVPRLEAEVRERVRLGVVSAGPVAVAPADAALSAELDRLAAGLRERYAGRRPAEIERLGAARQLYRAFGIDPTRLRPSSEALLRRVLKGAALPRIMNAVDVGNLCSLRFLLPLGLYDRDKLRPPVVLRPGRPAESYVGIRKADVHLQGRPTLADAGGPFGNPTSDSARTAVSPETRALLLVIFAPFDYPDRELSQHVEFAREAMQRHLASADAGVHGISLRADQ